MFHNSDQIADITLEIQKDSSALEYAKFACFSDNTFVFEHKNSLIHQEFSFISTDDIVRKMEIFDILNLKDIKYFFYRKWKGKGSQKTLTASIEWTPE